MCERAYPWPVLATCSSRTSSMACEVVTKHKSSPTAAIWIARYYGPSHNIVLGILVPEKGVAQ